MCNKRFYGQYMYIYDCKKNFFNIQPLVPLYECTAFALPLVTASELASTLTLAKYKSLTFKFAYVMGKALSGELSCMWTGPVRQES